MRIRRAVRRTGRRASTRGRSHRRHHRRRRSRSRLRRRRHREAAATLTAGGLGDLRGGVAQRGADLVDLQLDDGALLAFLGVERALLEPPADDDPRTAGEGLGDVLGHLPPHVAPEEQRLAVLPLLRLTVEGARGRGHGEVGDRGAGRREPQLRVRRQVADDGDDGFAGHGQWASGRISFVRSTDSLRFSCRSSSATAAGSDSIVDDRVDALDLLLDLVGEPATAPDLGLDGATGLGDDGQEPVERGSDGALLELGVEDDHQFVIPHGEPHLLWSWRLQKVCSRRVVHALRAPTDAGTRRTRLPACGERRRAVHRRRPQRARARRAAAVPARDDGRGAGRAQREARDAWCVRTSAAVTAASATTAARAAAGSVCAAVDGEAASLGALLVQPGAVQAGELAEDRHRGAVVAAGHAAGAARCRERSAPPRLLPGTEKRDGSNAAAAATPPATAAGRRRRSCRCTACPGRPGSPGRPAAPAAGCGRPPVPVGHRRRRAPAARRPPGRVGSGTFTGGSCGRFTPGRFGSGHERLDDVGHRHRQRRQRGRDGADHLVGDGGGEAGLRDDPVRVGDRAGGRRVVERPRRADWPGCRSRFCPKKRHRDVGVHGGRARCRPAGIEIAALVLGRDLVDERDRAALVDALDRRRDVHGSRRSPAGRRSRSAP